ERPPETGSLFMDGTAEVAIVCMDAVADTDAASQCVVTIYAHERRAQRAGGAIRVKRNEQVKADGDAEGIREQGVTAEK
ncbi:hypothetical protein HK101_006186, partial [Irineochytrium annulatum]